ncbi:MAG: protein-tyrosine phosphatase, partial [Acidimicrobiaceae bacterium]|nr:protein-tyrosine phosphatase [Acidimicrobiaceae bacterium]
QPTAGRVLAVSQTALDRLIPLGNVHNFRDLGGYETADGRHTRWRTLFRADSLSHLHGDDLAVVRALGLRSLIDLRMTEEGEKWGRFPIADHPIDYHHLTLMDVMWDPDQAPLADGGPEVATFLHERYMDMLDTGGANLGLAVRVLAAPGALPAVFHCAAGKDRTGMLAALLLSSLGVADDVVVADYALSGAALGRLYTWAERNRPEVLTSLREAPAAHLAAEPAAMAAVLASVHHEYGSARGFLAGVGVSPEVFTTLEAALLE